MYEIITMSTKSLFQRPYFPPPAHPSLVLDLAFLILWLQVPQVPDLDPARRRFTNPLADTAKEGVETFRFLAQLCRKNADQLLVSSTFLHSSFEIKCFCFHEQLFSILEKCCLKI